MTADDLRQKIELAIVQMIKSKLDSGVLDEARAQAISQVTLDQLKPGMTLEEFFQAVPRLDDQFPELSPIILPFLRQYEEKIVNSACSNVSELIRQGQYDAATQLAQKAVKQEVKLKWLGSSK